MNMISIQGGPQSVLGKGANRSILRFLSFVAILFALGAEGLAILIAVKKGELRFNSSSVVSVLPFCTPAPLLMAIQAYRESAKYAPTSDSDRDMRSVIWFWLTLSMALGYAVLIAAFMVIVE